MEFSPLLSIRRIPFTRLINMSKGGHVDLNSLSSLSSEAGSNPWPDLSKILGKKLPPSSAGTKASRFVPQSPWNCTWGPWRFRLGRYWELSHLLLLLSSLNRLFVGHLCNSLTQFGVIRNVEKISWEKEIKVVADLHNFCEKVHRRDFCLYLSKTVSTNH